MEEKMTRWGILFLWLPLFIFAASCTQNVSYESQNIYPNNIIFKRTHRDPISRSDQTRLRGWLKKPEGGGPFPAVVMLIDTELRVPGDRSWEERLVQWGYVVLQVDSMGSRDIALYDYGPGHHFNLYWQQHIARANDALDAKNYLAGLPFVRPDKIAVMGWSYGGTAIYNGVLDSPNPFQAAVVFYSFGTGCPRIKQYNTPLMVMSFKYLEKACRFQASLPEQNKYNIRINAYPVYAPGFDLAGERWLKFFHNIAAEYYFGVVFKYDEQAAHDATTKVQTFLAKHLKAP